MISAASIVFSAFAAAAMLAASTRFGAERIELFILAAVLIEGRLLANLLDGLVAVEGGLGSKSGEIWNELPDRFSDAIVLVAAGYASALTSPNDAVAAWSPVLGWAAALAAVMTAYVRALGSAAGAGAHFEGPMAKQRRMETLAAGCIVAAFEPVWRWNGESLHIALALVLIGSLITIARRTMAVSRDLEAANG